MPKKDRVWLRGCFDLAGDDCTQLVQQEGRFGGGKQETLAGARLPTAHRSRRRGLQGAPYKCPVIRELLWDWFVDVRRSVSGTITPKPVLQKARDLATAVLKEQRRSKSGFEPMPALTRQWLMRWKRDRQVVFRKPNLRIKASKEVMVVRLRAMWCNLIRIRRLAQLLLETDLADAIYGIDEKPIHFNESGSKAVRTLEIAGAPAVVLKQNHAATRERASVMTCVASSLSAASQPKKLPIEIVFRAASSRRLKGLVLPPTLNFSVQWAEKGSYRQEHLIAYMSRWLDPWSEDRQARRDYRILMIDVARSHLGEEVLQFAWSRGYILLLHYGCTTGVCQVHDTDLHGAFERVYVELEQTCFHQRQLIDPGDISRSLQDVIDDVGATWRIVDHSLAVRGHWRNGRLRAIAEVDAKVASGLTLHQWQSLVRHPSDLGAYEDEGRELEDALEDGEPSWADEAHQALIAADDADLMSASALDSAVVPIEPLPGDDPAEVDDAVAAVKRLQALKALRKAALDNRITGAFFPLDREIGQLERGLRGTSSSSKHSNAVLRRAMEKRAHEEAEQLRKKREVARAEAIKRRQARAAAAKVRAAAEKKKHAAASLKAKLDALPKEFAAADLGKDGAVGLKARLDSLERLKLRSPKLPLAWAVRWEKIRDTYAAKFRSIHGLKKEIVGTAWVDVLNKVLSRLIEHCDGETDFNKGGKTGGDPLAFLKFVQKMDKFSPKPASAVTV